MTRDDLLDALFDLEHDLGKYLRLPLAMLPADAGPGEVRAAAEDALLRTRRGPTGTTPAAEIWAAFQAEVSGGLTGPAFTALRGVVDQALSHAQHLGGADPDVLRTDLGAVAPAIRAVVAELRGNHG